MYQKDFRRILSLCHVQYILHCHLLSNGDELTRKEIFKASIPVSETIPLHNCYPELPKSNTCSTAIIITNITEGYH